MATNYKLRVFNGSTLRAEVTDMLWLQYTQRVNSIGMCQFTLAEGHTYAAEMVKNYRVEVWRQARGNAWYREETYIIRGKKITWNGITNDLLVTAVSGNWLLGTRIIAWAAGTANRSTFDSQKAETVMKNLVKYNLSALATTANGRQIAGDTSVTVQTDGAGGNTIDIACAYDNLLTTLQDAALVAGGDFGMTWTGTVWDFRFYAGQFGTDRTSALVFSLARGNLQAPSLTLDYIDEKTLALIGGQGEGADRVTRTKTGADWSADNQIELFVDARDVEADVVNEADLLDKRGETELAAVRARSVLDFSIAQSQNSQYGVDYFLGDLGKVVYAGTTATVQLIEVVATFAPGTNEQITVGVRNV